MEIKISAQINAPLEQVWTYWTQGADVTGWNFASADWHCPDSNIDLQPGGEFHSTMAAKDGSFSFDFWGTYSEIIPNKEIRSTMGDGRKLDVFFEAQKGGVLVTEIFEAENQNPVELQRQGWQAILDNFKKYCEK
ncbi:SRPBCC domain-containing protein [Algoriphagus confluentis]|uniref:SRPBCC family protein n=1 Tax=Algoriphagus confluentis TaxID=1697556 RepID=A0ABQ6PM02_9BACT|nr:SRPBCC family protein [Algoriphagus confluentis]